MTLAELFAAVGLKQESTIKLPSGGGSLESPFDVKAEDFLQRAEDDFEAGGTAAQLNALTNAKRAIDCQIDTVLVALGHPPKMSRKAKLQFLSAAGFVAPRILKRVVDLRNILEHDYRRPSTQEAEEALDIANLFVSAIARHVESFQGEFSLGNREHQIDLFTFSREVSVNFNDDRRVFSLRGLLDVRSEDEVAKAMEEGRHKEVMPREVGSVAVSAAHSAFPLFVRLANAGDREVRNTKALRALFEHLASAV